MPKLTLTIEPLPTNTWGYSLANKLPKDKWDEIRYACYRNADWQCEICGNRDSQLHAHEQWRFDERRRIQYLERVICFCELCHNVKHFGRSQLVYPKHYIEELIQHWCKVNNSDERHFNSHFVQVMEKHRRRASRFYTVVVGDRILL